MGRTSGALPAPGEFMKVALLTLGCRVNQSESDVIEGSLRAGGMTIVDLNEKPDFCIVNTCTVTAKGDYNSRQLIRRAAKTGAKVIVTGCYAQLRPQEAESISGVVSVVRNENKYEIGQLLSDGPTPLHFGNCSRSRPYLKVQDGCNFRCSYCAVPRARGKSRSVPVDEVMERVREIVSGGYKEIVLTGIHLGTYGHDLPEKTALSKLVKKILHDSDIHRIRLSSLEVSEVDDELIEIFQDGRICKHLHIPLQSGSDRVLKLMKRTYTAGQYGRRVEAIVSRTDNLSLGTDIIVGFPGEEDGDFAATHSLISDLPFSYLHIFPFSVRTDTEASRLAKKVSDSTVRERLAKMKSLQGVKKEAYLEAQIDRELEIIAEERLNAEMVIGTSGNYLKVRALSRSQKEGTVATVRPQSIVEGALYGAVIG